MSKPLKFTIDAIESSVTTLVDCNDRESRAEAGKIARMWIDVLRDELQHSSTCLCDALERALNSPSAIWTARRYAEDLNPTDTSSDSDELEPAHGN